MQLPPVVGDWPTVFLGMRGGFKWGLAEGFLFYQQQCWLSSVCKTKRRVTWEKKTVTSGGPSGLTYSSLGLLTQPLLLRSCQWGENMYNFFRSHESFPHFPSNTYVQATVGVGSGNFRIVDFGGVFFNWCVQCVLSDTLLLRCMMFIFCVKEADLATMAFVAYFAPWFSE